jgi:hypothetical protein
MAVVFLEGGLSPIPMRMASTKLHRGPVAGYVNSRIANAGPKIAKRNSLLKLDFLVSCEIVRLNLSLSTTIKK